MHHECIGEGCPSRAASILIEGCERHEKIRKSMIFPEVPFELDNPADPLYPLTIAESPLPPNGKIDVISRDLAVIRPIISSIEEGVYRVVPFSVKRLAANARAEAGGERPTCGKFLPVEVNVYNVIVIEFWMNEGVGASDVKVSLKEIWSESRVAIQRSVPVFDENVLDSNCRVRMRTEDFLCAVAGVFDFGVGNERLELGDRPFAV